MQGDQVVRKLQHTDKRILPRWGVLVLLVVASATIGGVAGLACVYFVNLPQAQKLERYRPISTTVLYDDEGRVFGSFALQRRAIARYEDYPKVLYDAVLSIEDKDFEKHPGFEVWRTVIAAYRDVISGGNVQGASTLTMQLARNLFLSPVRTYSRKLHEIMLAVQIERHFTKSQIFTLYANQIYLGHGVYGFAAGAEFYFGKHAREVTLEEAALLAALPKAPNNYSPIKSPERALRRRNVVINSMLAAGKISIADAAAAKQKPIRLHIQDNPNSLAPYFVEEIRQYLEKKYGNDQVHEAGLKVYTTLNMDVQKAGNSAVIDGLAAYDRRHGWRVRLQNVKDVDASLDSYSMPEWGQTIEPGTYLHAVVMSVSPSTASLRFGRYRANIGANDIAWTKRVLPQLLSAGDIAYIKVISFGADSTARVRLEEDSGVQGALLAIDSASGQVKALVGGRDFNQSKFNRATQALRQVGSSFKPYVYTAAIDQGAMPEDTILDVPVTFMTASGPYSPHNYDGKFEGTINLRHALAESRNVPALELAAHLGMQTVVGYAHRFGISVHIPALLTVALGAVELTLLEHTSAFTVFPNDGIRVIPSYIVKVTDYDGRVLEQNNPPVQDVISKHTARIMTSMLRDVVLHGTAIAASRMKFPVAGKTGTTNDFTDAWFIGFSPSMTCGVWIGFDQNKSLGNTETGAMAALPVWMDFMTTVHARDELPRDFPPVGEKMERRAAKQVDHSMTSQVLREPAHQRAATRDKRDMLVRSASQKTLE
ncbi:MAG: penicillin-binding protein [Acidobacteria bacterium]|nr:MAG: penicillin-binding protein [Acidobacteriota bacterium]